MKTINLTPEEQKQILSLAREIRKASFAELDQARKREDLYGLYSDIVQELYIKCNHKIGLFYEYAELLEDIIKLIPTEAAYCYSKMAKQEGRVLGVQSN